MKSGECPKCKSLNAENATYCRYCHERFNQAKTFVERKKKRRLRKKLLLAGGILTAATGYLWKKKSASKTS